MNTPDLGMELDRPLGPAPRTIDSTDSILTKPWTRNDPYPLAVLEDGYLVASQGPGWRAVLDKWHIGYVITASPGLVDALTAARWVDVGSDGRAMLLRRPD